MDDVGVCGRTDAYIWTHSWLRQSQLRPVNSTLTAGKTFTDIRRQSGNWIPWFPFVALALNLLQVASCYYIWLVRPSLPSFLVKSTLKKPHKWINNRRISTGWVYLLAFSVSGPNTTTRKEIPKKKPRRDRFCPWGWQIAGNIIHMLPYYSS